MQVSEVVDLAFVCCRGGELGVSEYVRKGNDFWYFPLPLFLISTKTPSHSRLFQQVVWCFMDPGMRADNVLEESEEGVCNKEVERRPTVMGFETVCDLGLELSDYEVFVSKPPLDPL